MAQRIAFATSAEHPRLTPDDMLAVQILAARGVQVLPVLWDAHDTDWSSFDCVVIRSTWDYHHRPGEFRDWIEAMRREPVPVWNSPDTILWNMNKMYLRDLAGKGTHVIPTAWRERGSATALGDLLMEQGWQEAVVKPCISATAYQTWRTSGAPEDEERFAQMIGDGDVMVQKFIPEITTRGEWSLVYFGGEFSHAVRKYPAQGDFRVQKEFGGRAVQARPGTDMIRQGRAVIGNSPGDSLYARVDGIEVSGELHVMELELIEPALFLASHPQSAVNFANAIQNLTGY